MKRPPERRGVFKAAAYALGEIGPDGSRSLVKAYNSSKYQPERDWVGLRADFLKALGRTKDVKQVEFLIDRAARDHEDEILRAAGIALGHFDEAKQKVRKNIVKELVKKLNEIFNKSRQSVDPGDPVMARAKYTLAAIERDWNQTLRKLTGQDFKTAPEWQRFYNKNKGKNWDR
ncbi:MAG: HEAT repeat domain-containing protein [Planctomycetota bacterium]